MSQAFGLQRFFFTDPAGLFTTNDLVASIWCDGRLRMFVAHGDTMSRCYYALWYKLTSEFDLTSEEWNDIARPIASLVEELAGELGYCPDEVWDFNPRLYT